MRLVAGLLVGHPIEDDEDEGATWPEEVRSPDCPVCGEAGHERCRGDYD